MAKGVANKVDAASELRLTPSQQQAYESLSAFAGRKGREAFILRGYAGTGKTTLTRRLVKFLELEKIPYRLLASTGRAAKVLSDATGRHEVSTVHSMLYTFSKLSQNLEEMAKKTEEEQPTDLLSLIFVKTHVEAAGSVYVIDEASMVSDIEDVSQSQAKFGSGRLLKDLMEFDPMGKYIFVGDACQLPPVKSEYSPALSAEYLRREYGIRVTEATLTDIVRQDEGNGIIKASQKLRRMYENPPAVKWAKFPLLGYPQNIIVYDEATQMVGKYISIIRKSGYNAATLICRTNKQCAAWVNHVSAELGFESRRLSPKMLLLVTQNNMPSGLMNGDMVEVVSVGAREKRAQLTFVHVEVRNLSNGDLKSLLLVEDLLNSGLTNLSGVQQKAIFVDFYYRMRDRGIKQGTKVFNDEMQTDQYLNSLRAVYGFAITCHKAQGGEWDDVFLDLPRNLGLNAEREVYQWLYTAVTRARKRLHIVRDFYLTDGRDDEPFSTGRRLTGVRI